jgi:hypothetical protein
LENPLTENEVLKYLSDVRVTYQKLIKMNNPLPHNLKADRNELLKKIEKFNFESSNRFMRVELPEGFYEMRLKNVGVCILYKHTAMSLTTYTYEVRDIKNMFYVDNQSLEHLSFNFSGEIDKKYEVDVKKEEFLNEFEKSFEKIQFTIDSAEEFMKMYELKYATS